MSRHRNLLDEHRALVTRVDEFEAAVRARRHLDMACRAGCSLCCHVQLTVCDVEADFMREHLESLDEPARARLRERLDEAGSSARDACIFLEDDGRCAAYMGRPLVCRTQGLPLRYPDGVIPEAAVRARAKDKGDPLTWCPLNFEERAPRPEDVLDAARVDTMLALSNREYAARVKASNTGKHAEGDPERRTSLLDLAREFAFLGAHE
jgi:hypothetical protein